MIIHGEWVANCETCGQPLNNQSLRWELTHSPNADILKGIRENHLEYSLHREHVQQADTHKYRILCPACFENTCAQERSPRFKVGDSPPKPDITTYKIKSTSQVNKYYEVTINLTANTLMCTCPWGMYTSNQDQGRTQKWCQHVLQVVKTHLK